jgi:hypothetical protein
MGGTALGLDNHGRVRHVVGEQVTARDGGFTLLVASPDAAGYENGGRESLAI